MLFTGSIVGLPVVSSRRAHLGGFSIEWAQHTMHPPCRAMALPLRSERHIEQVAAYFLLSTDVFWAVLHGCAYKGLT